MKYFGYFAVIFIGLSLLFYSKLSHSEDFFADINKYACYSIDLVNTFSIDAESTMISSERTNDCVFVTYEDGTTLKTIFKVDGIDLNLEVIYKSEKLPSPSTVIKAIEIILGDSISSDDEKKVYSFFELEETSTTIVFFDDTNIYLEKGDKEFVIKVK